MEQQSARTQHHRLLRGLTWSVAALGLMALGASGAFLGPHYLGSVLPWSLVPPPTPAPAVPWTAAPALASAPAAATEVILSPEAVSRAGITTARVEVIDAPTVLQVPGTVTADAYREVKVLPVLGGIVTHVHVELGTTVKRGAPLATLFSTELAEAQTKYLAMQATRTAAQQKLQRTQQLVEIGAASRQELEDVTALHANHAADVEAARQRLRLLGLTPAQLAALQHPHQVMAEVVVHAPIAGVITGRTANLGQVVSMGQELFVVTDLSKVWVIGDLYEPDVPLVSLGASAVMTSPSAPGLTLHGRVSYIDQRIDPQTRTVKLRVEVANPRGQLRLGLYVTMVLTTRHERLIVVPRAAVQTLGERQVVFVTTPDEAGTFVARTIHTGPPHRDFATIRGGVEPGDLVVTEGSFLLRAELLRNAPAGF